ncbi:DUF859 family phage minor structural protein, partial [Kitasatospora herbaricolor]|uniref:DUF859 family phage minor structural protein n=1 Tax=Kitasatospora herbaricolor TaxID=68217 RepID=UPI0036D8BD67
YTVVINGNSYSGTFTYDFRSTSSVTIRTGSTVVPHNSDGTKTITVVGSIGDTGSSAIGGPGGTGNRSFTQSTIARASKATVSPNPVNAGDVLTILTHRASTAFLHTLTYTFGNASGTIATNAQDVDWTVPYSLLQQIPNAVSGSGTITTKTYQGSTLIGTTTTPFTVKAGAEVVPTVSAISCSEATAGIAAAVGGYVQKVSKLALAVTSAAGVYGSTITGYKLQVDGQTINSQSGTTAVIQSAGTLTITATVTDSRGRTGTGSATITVLPYTPPAIDGSGTSLVRALSDGTPNDQGTYIRINLKASVKSLKPSTTEKNNLKYRISTRAHGTSTYTVQKNVTPGGISFNSFDKVG